MAIDPDVQVLLDVINTRLTALEDSPAVGDSKLIVQHSVTLEDGTVLVYDLNPPVGG